MAIGMREQILRFLAESIGEDVTSLNVDASPTEDYQMDSIAILDFVILIEDEFGLDFQEFSELSNHMGTIREMIDYMTDMIRG